MFENYKKVGIVGVGIVGVCMVLMFQCCGFKVILIDLNFFGEGVLFGNVGCFNGLFVVFMFMLGNLMSVLKWFFDLMGLLLIWFSYFLIIMFWLICFLLVGRLNKVKEQVKVFCNFIKFMVFLIKLLVEEVDVSYLICYEGYLIVYCGEVDFVKDCGGWELWCFNGVCMQIFSVDVLWDFDLNLLYVFIKGIFIEENGYMINL